MKGFRLKLFFLVFIFSLIVLFFLTYFLSDLPKNLFNSPTSESVDTVEDIGLSGEYRSYSDSVPMPSLSRNGGSSQGSLSSGGGGSSSVSNPSPQTGLIPRETIPNYLKSIMGPQPGSLFGMGVVDIGSGAYFAIEAGGAGNRYLINAISGDVIWRKSRVGNSLVPQEICDTNSASVVARLGGTTDHRIPYTLAMSNPFWGTDYGPGIGILNPGHVCIINVTDGAFLGSLEGYFGGEKFGSSIISLQDKRDIYNPVSYIGIGSPDYIGGSGNIWYQGAFYIYKIDDIVGGQYGYYPPEADVHYGNDIPNLNPRHFGYSASNVGDINGDSIDDFVVGDPEAYDDNAAWMTGALVLFASRPTNNGVVWDYQSTKKGHGYSPLLGIINPYLGNSLSSIKRGSQTFVFTGDPSHMVFNSATGLVSSIGIIEQFLISSPSGGRRQLDYVQSFLPSPLVRSYMDGIDFGKTLANVGDINGDGLEDLAVTAPRSYKGFSENGYYYYYYALNGAVYVLSSNTNSYDLSYLTYYPLNYAHLGGGSTSISGGSDINGDGKSEIVVGTHLPDNLRGELVILSKP